jgi:hypothetical protein
LPFRKDFEQIQCDDQALDRGAMGGAEDDSVTVALDENLGQTFEAEWLGQSHGLTSAIDEEFGGLHGACLQEDSIKVYITGRYAAMPVRHGFGLVAARIRFVAVIALQPRSPSVLPPATSPASAGAIRVARPFLPRPRPLWPAPLAEGPHRLAVDVRLFHPFIKKPLAGGLAARLSGRGGDG